MPVDQAGSRRRAAATLLLVSAFGLPGDGHAQATSDTLQGSRQPQRQSLESVREAQERIEARLEEILDVEARNGPHSVALIDQLLSLGLVYQEQGDHDLAVASFERALQIRRVNDGLQSIEQAPLLRQLIVSERARGNAAAVEALERRSLILARQNLKDIRAVPILRDIADRQLGVYERYLHGEIPPVVSISFSTSASLVPRDRISNRDIALWNMRQARRNLGDAIKVLLGEEMYESDELLEMEKKLLAAYYLEATSGNANRPRGEYLYRLGIDSHRRLAVYKSARSRELEDFARALVELADWHLLFSHHGQAFRTYREAYELLVQQGVPPAQISEILSPDVPITIPTFASIPTDTEASEATEEFIDVGFVLSRYGRSRNVSVLATGSDSTEALERKLMKLIRSSRFRPRIVGGESSGPFRYLVRYYGGTELAAAY